jgi:hypothetical protein
MPDKFQMTSQAVAGKTYTLFGKSVTSSDYYQKIKYLADKVMDRDPDVHNVIQTIQLYSRKN